MVTMTREDYDWLQSCYLSPIGGEWMQARALLEDWGHDSLALPWELVDAMGQAMAEAIMDAGTEFMREHGLVNLAAGETGPEATT